MSHNVADKKIVASIRSIMESMAPRLDQEKADAIEFCLPPPLLVSRLFVANILTGSEARGTPLRRETMKTDVPDQ
jgi:hypothetical protein